MEPIKSVQTKDYIAEYLRNEIFSNRIPAGEELTQEIVAEKLGISRMPVREAFQILEHEGFLERLPNRHIRVIGIRKENILHNFHVLSALETELSGLLIQEKRELAPLRQVFEKYEISVPQQGREICAERELAFHQQISAQLCDPYLMQMHHKFLQGYLTYALHYAPSAWKTRVTALGEILTAMEEGRQDALKERFYAYFEEIAQAMIKGETL